MTYQFLRSVHDLSPSIWNSLAVDDYPFTRHQWFAALESSGATSAESGWQPYHLVVGGMASPDLIVPAYIKEHSYGEYVFDWAWADAYQRYGIEYYPKLLTAVPFTPCYGPRFLGRWQDEAVRAQALAAIGKECERAGLSGWHCLFPAESVSEQLSEAGFARRLGCQFHWHNRGYGDFDEFVATFSSRKRKNVLKERRRVAEQGFTFEVLSGDALKPEHWRFFYQLYLRTYLKRSGHTGYLSEDFFQALGESMPEHCVLVIAHLEGQRVAASLLLRDSKTLYGRYWGCLGEFDFLHFETCYYQGIDYAIEHGLERFDGGAQGEHKLARGFEPVITYSNHWLADGRFNDAVEDFLTQESAMVRAYFTEAKSHLPYKMGNS